MLNKISIIFSQLTICYCLNYLYKPDPTATAAATATIFQDLGDLKFEKKRKKKTN